jgi:zinc protease
MQFPDYHRYVLPNGVTLLLIEKHDTPLISLSAALRSGSTRDPAGKEGLADLTNDLLRKGTRTRSAEQISEELDFMGATFETTTALEMTTLSTEFLKKDLTKAFNLFAEILSEPSFPGDEVSKLTEQRVDEIKANKDQPLVVISTYFRQFLFGDHLYGRPTQGDEKSVAALTREDVVRFHSDTYVSSNLIVAACGDFELEMIEKLIRGRFGSLPPVVASGSTLTIPKAVAGKSVLQVDKPDATQTFFCIGNTGVAVNDPDQFTLAIVNTIFGGRFTSRINTALRIDSGLSYGASSRFEPLRKPGSFRIASYTRNASTEEALDTALAVLDALHRKGITEAELASAKAYLKGQFGPRLETGEQLLEELVRFEIYGLDPREMVDRYAERIDSVTLPATHRVIKEKFPSKDLALVLIGKTAEIGKLAGKYGEQIRRVSIRDTGFGKPH